MRAPDAFIAGRKAASVAHGPAAASALRPIARTATLEHLRRAGDDAIVSVTNPMRLPLWSMPQPDFLLLKPRADDYASGHPGAGDVLLAVEVTDISLRYDRVTKSRVYASHTVREYWVVEVDAPRLHVFREPVAAEGRYASVRTLEAPFVIEASALPQVSLRSEEIWR